MKTLLTAVILLSAPAFAHDFKSKDFCSAKTKDMCAHIGYDKKPDNKEPFVFTFDIVNKAKAQDVKNVKIYVVTADKQHIPTQWVIRPDGHHWDAKADSVAKAQVVAIQGKYQYQGAGEEIVIDLK